MVRNGIENGGATDEFAAIGFFKDNQFSEADKLAHELCSLQVQMGPRIKLLREIIRNPVLSPHEVNAVIPAGAGAQVIETGGRRRSSLARDVLRKTCPEPIKKFYRVWMEIYVSP
jgi:hypothetical protein